MKTPFALSLGLIFIAAPVFAQTTITPPATTAPAITTTPNAVSGFAPNPVSGFAPNPIGGFSSAPVGGFAPAPINGLNTNPMGAPFQFAPLTTTPAFPAPATNPAVVPVLPNSQIVPPAPVVPSSIPNSITGTNQTPLF